MLVALSGGWAPSHSTPQDQDQAATATQVDTVSRSHAVLLQHSPSDLLLRFFVFFSISNFYFFIHWIS